MDGLLAQSPHFVKGIAPQSPETSGKRDVWPEKGLFTGAITQKVRMLRTREQQYAVVSLATRFQPLRLRI